MTRFVIDPGVALHLAQERAILMPEHQLLAPALIRSQLLSQLYAKVRRGELERAEADRRLDYVRGLRLRLLGDRVLQRVAWDLATELDLADTASAEYLALTRLQGDAFVTDDPALAGIARRVVAVATEADLT